MTKLAGDEAAIEKQIDNLLKGAIDPHVHSGPSIAPRAVDHLELAKEYSKPAWRRGDHKTTIIAA